MTDMEDVIARYEAMVYRLAYANLRSKPCADDVFQDVFLRYIKKAPEFENEEHRKAWLIRVTINCCRKITSSAWYRRTVPLDDHDLPWEMPEEWALEEQLRKLPALYRTVLHLFYYEDLPVDEIARLLKRKPATVRTQLTRARRLLEQQLKEEYHHEGHL